MNTAAIPCPIEDVQGDGRWLSMHYRFVNQAKEREPDVLFIGDSLVANLQTSDLWEKWFAPMHSLNFAIGGDQTQHVLWRLCNGELECISPRAVVLLIGANNYSHMAEEVAEGITEICKTIREKQPQAYIIVLSLLPRGEKPNSLRNKHNEINAMLQETLKNIFRCQVVNIGKDFVLSDGTISHRDMFDYLHLTRQGYKKAFEPVYELLNQLLLEDESAKIINDLSCQETSGAASTPSPQE